jgi:hypothetical protein
MATPKRRPADRIVRLAERVDSVASDGNSIAIAIPAAGMVLMRCGARCPRCARLVAEVAAAEPERTRLRQEYEAGRSTPAPKSAPETDQFEPPEH